MHYRNMHINAITSAKIIEKGGSRILAGEGVGKMKGNFSQGIVDTPLHALLGEGVPQVRELRNNS